MENDLFRLASRFKYRFDTSRGRLPAEDLWDLPLAELDESYKAYSRALKAEGEESLLAEHSNRSSELNHKRDIVVAIVRTKQTEADAAEQLVLRREKKARILELIAHKQDSELAEKSEDELRELLSELS